MIDQSPRCPRCNAIGPWAHTVKYDDREKTISYQCDACGHAWQSTSSAKPSWPPVSHNPPVSRNQ